MNDDEEQTPKHSSVRSTLVGLLVGSLMCFSNMYFGLQTGWISMMSLQASLLGFAILKPWQHSSFGPKENVYLQTVAVATATMPLAAGFVGIIPALAQLDSNDHPTGPILLPAWKLMLWSLGLSLIGVFFAIPLRKQTIIREQLPFPSGAATAQMIQVLHHTTEESRVALDTLTESSSSSFDLSTEDTTWPLKRKALYVSFSISSVYTLASYFFPILYALPLFNWISFGLVDFKAWEWYFTPSLSYVGQGMIMGLPTTLSMLLGCVVGWGMLSPMAYYAGWAPGPINDWQTGAKGWILWISLGVMISESIVSLLIMLVKQIHATVNSYHLLTDHVEQSKEDVPLDQQVPLSITLGGLAASIALCILTVQIVFGSDVMPIHMTCVSIVCAFFLSILGVRALGETDLNPVSGIGKMSQVVFAALMPRAIVANLIAGGIAEAGAQQAGDLMQDLKTGYLLQASPKAQFIGQLIGSCVSAVVATGAYLLYTTIYTVPGTEFPAPTAHVWLDMARLVNGHPLPPHVSEFVWLFGILFSVLTWIKETGYGYVPQGIAFAIGMYNPPSFTLARVIGGWLVYGWDRYCDQPDAAWFGPYRRVGNIMLIVASGFVLGEGTCAIVNMVLHALGVPHF